MMTAEALTRVSSRLPRRGAIATGITCAMSPNRRVSCAAASPRTPTTSDSQPRALGRKVSDEFAVPLCRGHHRAVHRSRDERAWWRQTGIDPIKVARRLWRVTRGMGQHQSERTASPRPHAAPDPKNEEIDATATPQEEPRLPDVAG